ncbi:MAG: hypothetical protein R3234_08080 [Thermoanaerobaculia bacterium]|nr:hypothetical protein [Thermoanaerobaculia bacterium]
MPTKIDASSTPRQVRFDRTPEIFATDNGGSFLLELEADGQEVLELEAHRELRLVVSVWHPSRRRVIDLDQAYVELRGRLDPEEEHWVKLVEIEPVIPAYSGGESFDGWIVLPVLAPRMRLALFGSGFEARARLQVRSYVYLVP